jgi:CheY-like chemotaxis protein
MFAPTHRQTPLVLVASPDRATANGLVKRLRDDGAVAYAAYSWQGCLRVATAVGPDVVLLDPALPRRLDSLLKAHPRSSGAATVQLQHATMHVPGHVAGPQIGPLVPTGA